MEEIIEKSIFKDLEIEELSPSSKIFLIGRYAEILFRFDQNVPDEDYFVLRNGARSFQGENNSKFASFEEHFEVLKDLRNKCVHTQNLFVATDGDFEEAKDHLYHLFSFLFFKYFLSHKFGENKPIMTLFSFLPPKIRAIALSELLKFEKDNFFLIDKAILAMVKSDNPDDAEKILEENSKFLKENQDNYSNISYYDFLKGKLETAKNNFLKKLYTNLPEAGTYYKNHRDNFAIIHNKEIDDLLILMDFVYKGF